MPKISSQARRKLTEERRKQILDAAAKVFAEKGFERATIADISRAAGVAEGSIYNYFKNKSDLLVSIPRQIFETPIETINAAVKNNLQAHSYSPEETLTTLANNMVATIRQNAQIFRILISALPSMKPAMREKYFSQAVMYALGTLENYFREQIKLGSFRQDLDPQIAARAFVGMFFPYIMLREVVQLQADASWNYDRLIATAVPLFLRGVLEEASQRKSK